MPSPSPSPSPSDVAAEDADLHVRPPVRGRAVDPAVLAAVAVGGVLGAETRYGLGFWLAAPAASWPVATWTVNVTGCLLIGALMVVLTELTSPHRLLRPFLGVGVLGGYTTFSTAAVEVHALLLAGRTGLALAYLFGTAVTALVAVSAGAFAVRGVAAGRRRARRARRAS